MFFANYEEMIEDRASANALTSPAAKRGRSQAPIGWHKGAGHATPQENENSRASEMPFLALWRNLPKKI